MALRLLRGAGIALGLGVMFAWFGVYQTANFPFPERVAYWSGLMAVGILAGSILTPLISKRLMPAAHPVVQIVVISLLVSVPVTLGLAVIEAASDGTVAPPYWWSIQYMYVLVVSGLLTTLAFVSDQYFAHRAAAASPAQDASPPSLSAAGAPTFVERLPMRLRSAQIYAVSAEDHYLRVHTSAGEDLILVRLADAIRELAALEGLQTHRSWWVARQGLADVSRNDGKLVLKLKSGVEAPVSRTYAKAVKDARWLS